MSRKPGELQAWREQVSIGLKVGVLSSSEMEQNSRQQGRDRIMNMYDAREGARNA